MWLRYLDFAAMRSVGVVQDAHRQERGHGTLGPCLNVAPQNPHPVLERAEHEAVFFVAYSSGLSPLS
jgi:hypothetical protein